MSNNDKLALLHKYVKMGWHLFPIHSGTKRPATPHGFKDATNDFARIERYAIRNPNANWAVACEASGLFVLDIDGEQGARSYAALVSAYSALSQTIVQATPRGGWHIFFKAPEGGLPSTVGKLGAGLDTRGVGGYVIVEPSVIDDSPYREYVMMFDHPLAPVPNWLSDLLMKPKREAGTRPGSSLSRYDANSSAARIAEWLSRAREGTRNNALFWAACELRRMGMSFQEADRLLLPVAISIGLTEKESTRTIISAFDRTE